jgi:hypothetical protein
MTKLYPAARTGQKGSILLVAIIFLVFFTLIAISIFKGSLTSVRSIGNMQWRAESIAAANDAIDSMLSTEKAFQIPPIFVTSYAYDVNGDGVPDIDVTFPVVAFDDATDPITGKVTSIGRAGPRCMRLEPIPTSNLDPGKPEDVNCMGSSGSSGGLVQNEGASVGFVAASLSLCANSEWSVAVRATDRVTNTTVDVVQGVGVRVLTTDVGTCN